MAPQSTVVDLSAKAAGLAAAAACLTFVSLALVQDRVLVFLHGEDGVIEIISALAYPVGAFFAWRLAGRTRGWPRAHWILWIFLCVIFFGEETSWLQHWTGYATPESVKAVNVQSEFNLHNLKIFEPDHDLVTTQGVTFAWGSLLSSQHLFYLGFATYFLLLPLARSIRVFDRFAVTMGVPRISTRFMLMVWVPTLLSIALTFACRGDALRKEMIGETREMVFSIAIALMIVIPSARQKTASTEARSNRRGESVQARPRRDVAVQIFSKIR
jgi:hypothetical protein